MALSLDSKGICEVLIRPGAPLIINSMSLGGFLERPKDPSKSCLCSVVVLSFFKRDETEASNRVVVAALIPEKKKTTLAKSFFFPDSTTSLKCTGTLSTSSAFLSMTILKLVRLKSVVS
ncbi:hypothetical protein EST38_g14650 [Candolleomyces aberdarensis]|uniref:Uncharacterized protein n=1 Tax=Candolleomyces aberdarensis TaxID=2316362 RepID=A0A4Q2CZE4_9AGAR|nr:hypothetical protein EST38_g14650 [Candolleomyces aberdarensis]